jgi:hypothetical protein
MNKEREIAYKVRHYLNLGADEIDRGTTGRLFEMRMKALSHQQVAVAQLSLAGIGHIATDVFLPHARALVAIAVLVFTVFGVSTWNDFQKADENGVIDSALLADDLPINAYLDKGFQAWLSEHASQD